MLYVPPSDPASKQQLKKAIKDEPRQVVPEKNVLRTNCVEFSQKQTHNIEVKLDLDVLHRVDEVYFQYIKKTRYYTTTFPIKQQDKLIAFQILFRCALLKKLLLGSWPNVITVLNQQLTQEFLQREFHVPIALHSLIDCYGHFSMANYSVRVKDEGYTMNNLAADIVRLCANHSGIARQVQDTQRVQFQSVEINKVHFLDDQSTQALKSQTASMLQTLYKEEIVVNLATGICKKSKDEKILNCEIILTYPMLEVCNDPSIMLSNYKRWLRKLSPDYPDFKELVLLGAAVLSETKWFFSPNIHTPVHSLVKELTILKDYIFTPKDILNCLRWKIMHNDNNFQRLIHFAFELCKSRVFKDILRTQLTSFSQLGNAAQLVVYKEDQKKLVVNAEEKNAYWDLIPRAKSQLIHSIPLNNSITLAHMFSLTKEVIYAPMYEGQSKHDVQDTRKELISKDFLPSSF